MRWRTCFAALACASVIGGCQERDDAPPASAASDSPDLTRFPVADPRLDREALLLAVVRAASSAALGEEDDSVQRDLDGKPFELRLRFGCAEEGVRAQSDSWMHQDGRMVRMVIAPEIDVDTPLVQELAGPDVEAVEGFWIRRSWQLKAGCPPPLAAGTSREDAPESGTPQVSSTAGTTIDPLPALGIAQFFRETDARTHRRDRRPYEVVFNLSAGEVPSRSGYDLIIEGRLQSRPDGKVIACRVGGPERPSCVISARFEEVSLERADTGELLAEWPRG